MMSWLYYLLEANLYLILFYGLYKIALQQETFFKLNRFYLISSSILALILPLIQLGFLRKPASIPKNYILIPQDGSATKVFGSIPLLQPKEEIVIFDTIITSIYLVVALALIIKLVINVFRILKMKRQPSLNLENGIKLIELNQSQVAFSFFNLIFLDPTLPNKSTIIKHELAHIRQKHSFDVVFFEVLQIVNWFNPIVHLLKNDIKLLHEYLADQETTSREMEKYNYAMFLIQNSVGFENLKLTNQIFNSSILKKRIKMLNQKKSANWARLRLLLTLPLAGAMVCSSTMAFTKDYVFLDLYPKTLPHSSIKAVGGVAKKSNHLNKLALSDEEGSFYPLNTYNIKTNNAVNIDTRYIVINGKPIEDNSTFYGLRNAKKIIHLSKSAAIKKYGLKKGSDGAVEIIGDHIEFLGKVQPPPPIMPQTKAGLNKTILLPSPPKIKGKENIKDIYSVDVNLNRAKSEKLLGPETEKGKKSISIYTNRGQKVFISDDYKDNWDGKTNSFTKKPLETGEYSYEMIFQKEDGSSSKTIRGYITLK